MNDFPMSGIYELLKLSRKTIKQLNNIICPILLIHSEQDDLTSVKSAKVVYSKVLSQNKELIILKDSYHMVLYDNEKDFVFEKSQQFLDNYTTQKTENEAQLCLKS